MSNKMNYRLFMWGVQIPVRESWNYAHTIYILTEGGAIYKQEKDRDIVEYYKGSPLPSWFYQDKDPGRYDIDSLIDMQNPLNWAVPIYEQTDAYIIKPPFCYMSDDTRNYIKGLEQEIKELREENVVIHKSNRQKNLEIEELKTTIEELSKKNAANCFKYHLLENSIKDLIKQYEEIKTNE